MGTIPYEPFGLNVDKLNKLKWASVKEESEDGDRWFVEEEGSDPYKFEVSLTRTERNSTPEGTKPIEQPGFPTDEDVKKAIALAIKLAIASPKFKKMKPGRPYPIRVTRCDLYRAAGVVC